MSLTGASAATYETISAEPWFQKEVNPMSYGVRLLVFLKEGVLDTQGKTVAASLKGMGYNCLKDLRVGKYIHLDIVAHDGEEAVKQVEKMCDDLLVNDIIEEFKIELEDSHV